MIETAFFNAINGIATGGVWNSRLPQNVVFPAVVFTQIQGTPIQSQLTYVRCVRYQVDVWARTYEGVASTAQAVRNKLDHYMDGGISSLLDAEHEMGDPQTGLFRRVLEFVVWEV